MKTAQTERNDSAGFLFVIRMAGRGVWFTVIGMVVLFVPIVVGFAVCLIAGWIRPSAGLSVEAPILFILTSTATILLTQALPQELAFRGYLFNSLSASKPLWIAVVVQAGLFAVWSVLVAETPTLTAFGFGGFAFGVIAGTIRAITGSVWPVVGFHVVYKVANSFFGPNAAFFEISAPDPLANILLIFLPLGLSLSMLRLFFKKRVNWQLPTSAETVRAPTIEAGPHESSLGIRGIHYDTGVSYAVGHQSRPDWDASSVARDMRVIARELHGNTVMISGAEVDRMREASVSALEEGMTVWIQPRLVNATRPETLVHLEKTAHMAEALRKQYGKVVLNIGCELSLLMKGIVPGKNMAGRMTNLTLLSMLLFRFNMVLNVHLKRSCELARRLFDGPLTYSAGAWEDVDWTPFDYVGVNYYMDSGNEGSYIQGLRDFKVYGKPFVITEFGCCTYKGAEKKGGGGFDIIRWTTPPTIKPGYVRDEGVQADYIEKLISIYREEHVGHFVYSFSEPGNPHTENPETDMDMAGYGIVKHTAGIGGTSANGEPWEKKEAFARISRLYGQTS